MKVESNYMKIDHVTILVSSLEKSMPYYDTLLPLIGFTKKKDHIWTDNNGFFFQFHSAKSGTSHYERFGAGLNHLGFGASSPEEVERVRHSMQQAGFEVPEIQNLDGAVALFMKNPDGIRFEITYYPSGVEVVD